jgi:RNA polymerase sigma factor (sigma-70 family)
MSAPESKEMRHVPPEWLRNSRERIEGEIRRILGPRGAIEDIAQDVILLALEKGESFESEGHLLAWCILRARWLALDRVRVIKRERNMFGSLSRILRGTSHPPTQEDEFFNKELSHDLAIAISQLPDAQKRVCQLMFSGKSTPEISRAMNIEPETVRSHFRHAKKRLADALPQFNIGPQPMKGDDA